MKLKTKIVVLLVSIAMLSAYVYAQVKISAEPRTTSMVKNDDFLINASNSGFGTFTTKIANLQTLANSMPDGVMDIQSTPENAMGTITPFTAHSWSFNQDHMFHRATGTGVGQWNTNND